MAVKTSDCIVKLEDLIAKDLEIDAKKKTAIRIDGLDTENVESLDMQIDGENLVISYNDKKLLVSNYTSLKYIKTDYKKIGRKEYYELYNIIENNAVDNTSNPITKYNAKKLTVTGTNYNDKIDLSESGYAPVGATNIKKNKGITFNGGNGSDTLVGTDYNDVFTGGTGKNTINYTFGAEKSHGNDVINLTKGEKLTIKINDLTDIKYEYSSNKKDLIIYKAKDSKGNFVESITLKNFASKDVTNNATKKTENTSSVILTDGNTEVDLREDFYLYGDSKILTEKSFTGTWLSEEINARDLEKFDKNGEALPYSSKGLTLDGKGGNDKIYGSSYSDTIKGGDGNDEIYGNEGNDTITGGTGRNTINYTKGDGNDVINLTKGENFTLSLEDVTDIDNVKFEFVKNDLRIYADNSNKEEYITIKNFVAKDVTNNSDAKKAIEDTSSVELKIGSETYDLRNAIYDINGDSEKDYFYQIKTEKNYTGSWLNEDISAEGYTRYTDKKKTIVDEDVTKKGLTINGGDGADKIVGSRYSDIIIGGNGNDEITGGKGADTITGGTGRNTINYTKGDGNDVINLTKGENFTLSLEDVTDIDNVKFEFVKNDLRIYADNSNKEEYITIKNFVAKDVTNNSDAKKAIEDTSSVEILINGERYDLRNAIYDINGDSEKDYFYQIKTEKNYTGSWLNEDISAEGYTRYTDKKKTIVDEDVTKKGLTINGGDGADKIVGSRYSDIIIGGNGNDIINGEKGNDAIYGGSGENRLIFSGDFGKDTIYEEKINAINTIEIDSVAENPVGKSGNDLIVYKNDDNYIVIKEYFSTKISNKASYKIKIGTNETITLDEFLVGKKLIIASKGLIKGTDDSDIIYGSASADTIFGYDGDDVIKTYEGNDIVTAGAGNDTINAGKGSNILKFAIGDGNDVVENGEGTDTLSFANGVNVTAKVSNEGVLTVSYGNSGDKVIVNDWNESHSVKYIQVGNSIKKEICEFFPPVTESGNVILGTDQNDVLKVSVAKKTIIGYAGNDIINGSSGIDYIYAGCGDDIIEGSKGNDCIITNSGNDTIILSSGDGADTIYDVGEQNTIIEFKNLNDFNKLKFSVSDYENTFFRSADLRISGYGTDSDYVDIVNFFSLNASQEYDFTQYKIKVGDETRDLLDFINNNEELRKVCYEYTVSNQFTVNHVENRQYGTEYNNTLISALPSSRSHGYTLGQGGNDTIYSSGVYLNGDDYAMQNIDGGNGNDIIYTDKVYYVENGIIKGETNIEKEDGSTYTSDSFLLSAYGGAGDDTFYIGSNQNIYGDENIHFKGVRYDSYEAFGDDVFYVKGTNNNITTGKGNDVVYLENANGGNNINNEAGKDIIHIANNTASVFIGNNKDDIGVTTIVFDEGAENYEGIIEFEVDKSNKISTKQEGNDLIISTGASSIIIKDYNNLPNLAKNRIRCYFDGGDNLDLTSVIREQSQTNVLHLITTTTPCVYDETNNRTCSRDEEGYGLSHIQSTISNINDAQSVEIIHVEVKRGYSEIGNYIKAINSENRESYFYIDSSGNCYDDSKRPGSKDAFDDAKAGLNIKNGDFIGHYTVDVVTEAYITEGDKIYKIKFDGTKEKVEDYPSDCNDISYSNISSGGETISQNTNNLLINNNNETITGSDSQNDVFIANKNNKIIITNNGNNVVYGSDSNTTITCGTGKDIVYAGAGNDTIIGGGTSAIAGFAGDVIYGGAGDDTIYSVGTAESPSLNTKEENIIYGGDGNDTIYANGYYDTVYGEDGDDLIYSYSGSGRDSGRNIQPMVDGGAGNDKIYVYGAAGVNGGAGDDLIDATKAKESVTLIGGFGADTIKASNHGDSITGGSGDDIIYGGDGDDIITGGANSLWNSDSDTIYAGKGDDSISVSGTSIVDAGEGDDTITVAANHYTWSRTAVTINGGSGNDTYILEAGYADNIIEASEGNDVVILGNFNDSNKKPNLIQSGNDLIINYNSYTLGASFASTLILKDYYTSLDKYNNWIFKDSNTEPSVILSMSDFIKYCKGNLQKTTKPTNGNDWIEGNNQATLNALGGHDIINSNKDNKIINGGAGNDIIFGCNDKNLLVQTLNGDDGDDVIYAKAGSGTSVTMSETYKNYINGGDGNDIIYGASRIDSQCYIENYLNGGDGNDTIYAIDPNKTSSGIEKTIISGGAGDDIIYVDRNTYISDESGTDKVIYNHSKNALNFVINVNKYGSTTNFVFDDKNFGYDMIMVSNGATSVGSLNDYCISATKNNEIERYETADGYYVTQDQLNAVIEKVQTFLTKNGNDYANVLEAMNDSHDNYITLMGSEYFGGLDWQKNSQNS